MDQWPPKNLSLNSLSVRLRRRQAVKLSTVSASTTTGTRTSRAAGTATPLIALTGTPCTSPWIRGRSQSRNVFRKERRKTHTNAFHCVGVVAASRSLKSCPAAIFSASKCSLIRHRTSAMRTALCERCRLRTKRPECSVAFKTYFLS